MSWLSVTFSMQTLHPSIQANSNPGILMFMHACIIDGIPTFEKSTPLPPFLCLVEDKHSGSWRQTNKYRHGYWLHTTYTVEWLAPVLGKCGLSLSLPFVRSQCLWGFLLYATLLIGHAWPGSCFSLSSYIVASMLI